jgi:hypothetical protein
MVQFLLTTLLLRQVILGRPGTFLSFSFICRATVARRVVFGLKLSLMRRATVARRAIFWSACIIGATVARWLVPLRVTASLSWDPQFSRDEVFDFWRRCSAASFWSLRRFFFGSPTGITVAFSAGTSYSSAASGFLSAEVGFSSSGCTSIPWQAIVSTSVSGLNAAAVSLWLVSVTCMAGRMASVLAW